MRKYHIAPPVSLGTPKPPHFPIQNVENMRLRMSSAVVALSVPSMAWSAP
jgi:hypothetical protein